jgi:putative ABC transport system permease protein
VATANALTEIAMWFARARSYVRNLLRGPRIERDLDLEVRGYLDMLTDEHIARGLSPEQARRAAQIDVGGMDQVKERVRESRSGGLTEQVFQDARYGLRLLKRSPGFAAVAILTLALGSGATTAIFSVLYTVLLKPLPYPEAEQLVEIYGSNLAHGWDQSSLSHGNFWDIQDLSRSFSAVGAMGNESMSLTGLEYPEKLSAAQVTVGFLGALRMTPRAGRAFVDGEDRLGGSTHVVMLAERFWSKRFGRDPGVIGRTLTLDGEPYRVVGVQPADDRWLAGIDVLVPLVRTGKDQRGSFELGAVGRLRPGVTLDAARADLQRVAAALVRIDPKDNEGLGLVAVSSSTWIASESLRRSLWLLMGAVGFLLLIACVNLSNMLLARAAGRARETAVRTAVGATRARLVRQLLTESLVLSAFGAAAGICLAAWLLAGVRTLDIEDMPRLAQVTLNGWALAVALGVMVVTTALIALLPALHAPRVDLVPALREGERGVSGAVRQQRLRSVLVAAEVALSLLLLIGAGLLLRSLDAVLRVDRGFQADQRVLLSVNMPTVANDERGQRSAAFLMALLDGVAHVPGVTTVAAVSGRPLSNGSTGMGIAAPERPNPREVPWASWRLVSSDYFRTLGVPLLRGRVFTDRDRMDDSMKVVISKRLADLLWPGEDPVGRRVILWKGQNGPLGQVVGVVGNMRERGLSSDPTLAVYFPYYGAGWSPAQLVVHTALSPEALMPLVRQVASRVDKTVPVSDPSTLDAIVSSSVGSRRLIAGLLGSFAAVALILSLIGIYGVLSYSVARRTTEIGVRMALGATATSVLRLVLVQGLRPVIVGLAIGVGAALWLSRLMTSLLFEVTPTDPLTYLGLIVLLTVAATLACILPARQAAHVNVTSALRTD